MMSRRSVVGGLGGAALTASASASASATSVRYQVRRLVDGPIVAPGIDARMGRNIEGPSLIAAPPWLPNRLGAYYLYFADHKGDYIRLAYADRLEGPWKIHAPGSLQFSQSKLPAKLVGTPEAVARLNEILPSATLRTTRAYPRRWRTRACPMWPRPMSM
jgi:hypothetical protein